MEPENDGFQKESGSMLNFRGVDFWNDGKKRWAFQTFSDLWIEFAWRSKIEDLTFEF